MIGRQNISVRYWPVGHENYRRGASYAQDSVSRPATGERRGLNIFRQTVSSVRQRSYTADVRRARPYTAIRIRGRSPPVRGLVEVKGVAVSRVPMYRFYVNYVPSIFRACENYRSVKSLSALLL